MLSIIMFARIGGRVIHRALLNPSGQKSHFDFLERSFAFRHPHLAILRRDHFQDGAFIRMPRGDGHAFAFAAREEAFEIGHHIAALGFGRLMTSLAIRLQNGPYLLK